MYSLNHSGIEVTSSTDLIYDFYGFPKEMYEYKYNAPRNESLAQRIVNILKDASFQVKYNAKRGIDHGTWVPLALMFPEADVPIVQISLNTNLDMNYHIELGKALRPLLDENVLIMASGGSVHSFEAIRNNRGKTESWVHEFESWVEDVLTMGEDERNVKLKNWEQSKYGRKAHPREEHWIPVGVASGASNGKGHRLYTNVAIPNFSLSFYEFDVNEE